MNEFALSALFVVAAVIFGFSDVPEIGVPSCLVCAVALSFQGARRGRAADRRGSQENLATLASQERLANLASQERLALASRPRVELEEVAQEVKSTRPAISYWTVKRGEIRRSSMPPSGVDPFEYLIYRHTRSAAAPPEDPALPHIKHFVDLREAALIAEDRRLMVELLEEHIRRAFPGHDAYTGVLIPRTGNVALGVGVAERLGLQPVLVRDGPLFGRSTESVLTAGLLILVDDIWSDGAILRRAVELARFDNFSVADGVILIARSEGNVEADLDTGHVTLRPCFKFDDSQLDSILNRVALQIRESQEED